MRQLGKSKPGLDIRRFQRIIVDIFKFDNGIVVLFLKECLLFCWFANWPHCTEAKERCRKEAEPCRAAGGSSSKQRSLHRRLLLSGHRTLDLCVSTRILRVHIAALTGFSYLHCPDSFGNTLLS